MFNQQHVGWRVRILAGLTILMGMTALLATCEAFMRWRRPDMVPSNQLCSIPDPFIGWRYLPCQEIDGKTEHGEKRHIRINALGFADSDHDLGPSPGALRLAFLGDSFTAAAGVDADASFVSVARRRLQARHPSLKIETLNFGLPSFGTTNEYLTWKRYVAPFGPKIVVLVFFLGNDVSDNLPHRPEGNMNAPKFDLVNGELCPLPFTMKVNPETEELRRRNWFYRKVLAPSLLYQQYKLLERDLRAREGGRHTRKLQGSDSNLPFWKRSYAPLEWQVYLREPGPEFEVGWQVTEKLLIKLRDEVAATGARFHVALLPGVEAMDLPRFRSSFPRYPGIEKIKFDLDWPRRRLSSFLATQKISFVDLSLEFQKESGSIPLSKLYFKFDPHFSIQGHLLAGEAVARHLDGDLPMP